jgi:Ca-activated chloride channel family protein
MRRRSILKWTVLTTISIATVLVMFSSVHSQTQGGALKAFDKDGKPTGECPLKHTEVKAQVSGFLSRVTVTQDFENNFPEKIEAVYTFPLPQTAAVDDLTMLIGERAIKGKIMRRKDAQSAYAAAKQIGKIATLLDQERANIFTQQVANILPGQRIRVRIRYLTRNRFGCWCADRWSQL